MLTCSLPVVAPALMDMQEGEGQKQEATPSSEQIGEGRNDGSGQVTMSGDSGGVSGDSGGVSGDSGGVSGDSGRVSGDGGAGAGVGGDTGEKTVQQSEE